MRDDGSACGERRTPDGCPGCAGRGATSEAHRERALRLELRLDALRRSSRAMAGLDADALRAVTPGAMRAVLLARGWSLVDGVPWYRDPSVTAFERWDRPSPPGAPRRRRGSASPLDVLVPVMGAAPDVHRRVAEWAQAVASRHGDVSPAEVLSEALAEALWGGP